MKQSPSWEADS